ncbi:MAG: PKD domain-containing protein [Acetivibrionales bacterium]|jgi:PKD repeat protein
MKNARIVLVCLGVLAWPSVSCLGCPDDDPIAIIAELSAYSFCRGATINFDGSASYDPDDIPPGESPSNHPGAGIASYEWSFGGGVTGSGANVSHAFTTAGYKTVTLTVTDNEGSTGSMTCSFYIVEVQRVEADYRKENGETLYAANTYLDEPSKRPEISVEVVAYAYPAIGFPSGCFSWSPGCGETLPKICPEHSHYGTFTAKDHGAYTATGTCGDSSQFVKIVVEGIDISAGGIPAADETTVPYNIFVNNNFTQAVPDTTLPGHLQCCKPDNTDNDIVGEYTDELGQITVALERYGDEQAQVKFSSDGIKLYRESSYATYEKIVWNEWYDANDVTGSLYVEGEYTGPTTLTATLKTQDGWLTSDSLLVKVISLDLSAVSPAPYNDRHEICHKDNLVIQVNDNDSDMDSLADKDDPEVPGGDPDLGTVRLSKPYYVTADDFGGNFTVTFPGNLRAYLNRDKTGGALGGTYQVSYDNMPAGGVTFYIEGYAPSGAILGTEITAEVALNSGVVCRDSIKYTVIKVDLDMDGVADPNETIEGAFLAVNDDNDDWDGIVDVDDGYNKDNVAGNDDDGNAAEDDLVRITLHAVEPADLTGSVVLNGDSSALSVWTNAKKGAGNRVTLPATYSTPAGMPRELWVEGIAESGIRGGQLSLTYTLGWQTFSDIIKITVHNVNLSIWNGRGADLKPVADADEYTLGAYLLVNSDDDNRNNMPDCYDPAVNGEDDLAKITLDWGAFTTGTLELITTGANYRIWQSSTKQTEQTIFTWDLASVTPPSTLWVEGFHRSDSERDVVFELRYTLGTTTVSDTVKATVVQINLGNAVYRENALWYLGMTERGHSGIVTDFVGAVTREDLLNPTKFRVTEMNGPHVVSLATITDDPDLIAWGCYANVSQMTFAKRLQIVKMAKELVGRAVSIDYTAGNVVRPVDWDGTSGNITHLRCDGLVEVCYELNEINVWARARSIGGTTTYNYPIQDQTDVFHLDDISWCLIPPKNDLPDNLEEHNWHTISLVWFMDKPYQLWPATQIASTAGAHTMFTKQNLCMPIGCTGGN